MILWFVLLFLYSGPLCTSRSSFKVSFVNRNFVDKNVLSNQGVVGIKKARKGYSANNRIRNYYKPMKDNTSTRNHTEKLNTNKQKNNKLLIKLRTLYTKFGKKCIKMILPFLKKSKLKKLLMRNRGVKHKDKLMRRDDLLFLPYSVKYSKKEKRHFAAKKGILSKGRNNSLKDKFIFESSRKSINHDIHQQQDIDSKDAKKK